MAKPKKRIISVFGSGHIEENFSEYQRAALLGRVLAEHGFVICTGGNPRQIQAIADAVSETLKKEFGERPALAEGIERSEWILLDYFDFVVHVFSRDCRSFYGLERLWGNAERHEFFAHP